MLTLVIGEEPQRPQVSYLAAVGGALQCSDKHVLGTANDNAALLEDGGVLDTLYPLLHLIGRDLLSLFRREEGNGG